MVVLFIETPFPSFCTYKPGNPMLHLMQKGTNARHLYCTIHIHLLLVELWGVRDIRPLGLWKGLWSFGTCHAVLVSRCARPNDAFFTPPPLPAQIWAGRGVGRLAYFPIKVIFMPYSSDFHSFKICFMNCPPSKITIFSFYTKSL